MTVKMMPRHFALLCLSVLLKLFYYTAKKTIEKLLRISTSRIYSAIRFKAVQVYVLDHLACLVHLVVDF